MSIDGYLTTSGVPVPGRAMRDETWSLFLEEHKRGFKPQTTLAERLDPYRASPNMIPKGNAAATLLTYLLRLPPTSEEIPCDIPRFPTESSELPAETDDISKVRVRYHQLVDKEFREGLNAEKEKELADLDRRIDEYEMSQPQLQHAYFSELNQRLDESIEEAQKAHERLDAILAWLESRKPE